MKRKYQLQRPKEEKGLACFRNFIWSMSNKGLTQQAWVVQTRHSTKKSLPFDQLLALTSKPLELPA